MTRREGWGRLAAAAALAALLAGPGRAMDKAGGHDGSDGPGGGWGGPKRLAKWLDLTPDQQTKMKAAMDAREQDMKPRREKLRTTMDELRLLVDRKAGDDQLKAKIEELKAQEKDMADARHRHQEAIAAILTPSQQAKFLIGMQDRMRGGKGPMGGGRHGPGRDKGGHDRDGDDDD